VSMVGAQVRLERVCKRYADTVVLHELSLDVAPGEVLSILGPSGAGKTTTLMLLAGIVPVTSGRIEIGGRDVTALPAHRRDIGVVFQSYALFPHLSVFDNVAFPLRRSGRPPAEVRERVRECLALVRLPNVEGKRPSELSGGMRRRVGFARAIAHRPEILLFDEPNTGLDPIMTDVIDEVILEMKERLDVTIVTITHHMESARKIGDRIALLAGGRILFEAPPEEFLRSDHPAVRQFVQGSAKGPLTVEFQREESPAVSEVP